MSVVIHVTPHVENTRTFIFEGRTPIFPKDESFVDKTKALQAGYYGAAFLLGNPRIAGVRCHSSAEIKDYKGGKWDCLEVTMNAGHSWDNVAKAAATQMNNMQAAAPKTVAEIYAGIMQNEFFAKNTALYLKPQVATEDNILIAVNNHFKTAMANATPTHEEMDRRQRAGAKLSVYDTIRAHAGSVRAQSYRNGTLTILFSGNCAGNCVNKDTGATQSGIKADLKSGPTPFVEHYHFVQQ